MTAGDSGSVDPAGSETARLEVPGEEVLSGAEVRRRAKRSVILLAARSLGLRVFQIAGLVVLARLLTPADFGAVSVGLVFAGFGTILVEAGLGATLIRQEEAPERADLATLLGFQLATAVAIAVGVSSVAIWFGEIGVVTAVLVAALPIMALRGPATILLERRLDYRGVVYADIADTLAYYGWAIATAAAGWGVWSIATATIPRALAGTAALLVSVPEARIRPHVSRRRLQRMLGFGFKLQLVDALNTGRDQGLNIGLAALGGLGVLGAWSYAFRIMQIPYMLFNTLWRVSFPAMSRLVQAHENMRPIIERGVALTGIASALVLVPIAVSGPTLVMTVLGEQWESVGDVLPLGCLALILGGPISVSVAGYLYAVGDARTPLIATAIHAVVFIGIALLLLGPLGLVGVGLGWVAAALVDAVILGRQATVRSGARLVRPLAVPALAATASGGIGLALAQNSTASAVVAGVLAEVAFLGAITLFARENLLDLVRMTVGAARRAR